MTMTTHLTDPGRIPGPSGQAIFQIHPSLRCNLFCQHCYSSAGPKVQVELEVETVCKAVSDAAAMGYRVVSVSGGEPLIYKGLTEVLSHAKALGLRTTVTTNGFFLNERQLRQLEGRVDRLAISLDGPPALHNQLRGSPRAFERLKAGLEHVRNVGLSFGFIHTLTQQTWEHLLWVAAFAAEQGAGLLQIHPLELAGRAEHLLGDAAPDRETFAKVYLLVFALTAKYHGRLAIQLDLLHCQDILEAPELVYAAPLEPGETEHSPAALLSPLVLAADGTVVPISYGFSRAYQVCNIHEQHLTDAWPSYVQTRYPLFRALCREVFEQLCAPDDLPLFNWLELIAARSHTLAHQGNLPPDNAASLAAASKTMILLRSPALP